MPIELHHEGGNTYRLQMAGVLGRAELARCERELAVEIARAGAVRLLCVLTAFEGWEPTAVTGMSFYMTYGDAIERIAIVGDERWRSETLMFAAADLRRAPVEFFPEHRLDEARAWLGGTGTAGE